MIERIEDLRAQAQAELSQARSSEELERLRVRYLGRKAELPLMLREVAQLPADERAQVGKAANAARVALEELIERREREIVSEELTVELGADRVDVTLPGA